MRCGVLQRPSLPSRPSTVYTLGFGRVSAAKYIQHPGTRLVLVPQLAAAVQAVAAYETAAAAQPIAAYERAAAAQPEAAYDTAVDT